MGHGGNAAADGDFLPAVHAARGRGVSAARGVQPRQALPRGGGARAAEPDDVHGLRLQCLRRDGMPHHRQPARAARRHPLELLCALQRAVPDAARAHQPVFPRREPGRGADAARDGAFPAGDPVFGGDDAAGLAAFVIDGAARRAVGVFAGAAAVPDAAVCFWQGLLQPPPRCLPSGIGKGKWRGLSGRGARCATALARSLR